VAGDDNPTENVAFFLMKEDTQGFDYRVMKDPKKVKKKRKFDNEQMNQQHQQNAIYQQEAAMQEKSDESIFNKNLKGECTISKKL
jgi:hypothetical protein